MIDYDRVKQLAADAGLVPSTRVERFAQAVYDLALKDSYLPPATLAASTRLKPRSSKEKMLDYFRDNPGEWLTSQDMMDKWGISKTITYRNQSEAIADGQLLKIWRRDQRAYVYKRGPGLK